jgi:hypothetical protein
MYKALLTTILFSVSFLAFSQFPTPPERYIGWTINENFNSFQKTSDGGVIGVNTQTKKYLDTGVLQFTLNFPAKTVLQTSDGGYVMAINTNTAQTALTSYYGGFDLWIVKVNATGTVLWQKTLSGSGDDFLQDMKLNSNGDLMVMVNSNSTDYFGVGNQGGKDLWLVHLSSIGTQTKINLGGSADETFKNVEPLSSTETLVCLTTSSQNGVFAQGFKGGIDTWVLKITKGVTMSITQQRAYGGYQDDEANLTISNQKYLLAGYSKSNSGDLSVNKGLKDIWICFINPDGTLISSNNYGGTSDDYIREAVFNPADNSFYILGTNTSNDGDFPNPLSGQYHDRLFKFSNFGNFTWRRDYFVYNSYSSLRLFNDTGIYLTGTVAGNGTNLFTEQYVCYAGRNFFCKLSSFDGGTEWFKTSSCSYSSSNLYVGGKFPDGNFLFNNRYYGGNFAGSTVFTTNSQGVDVRTNFTYSAYKSGSFSEEAIVGDNSYIYVKFTNGTIRKICTKVYAGITRQEKYYCNLTSVADTLRVPDDIEFNFQWKRNGLPISGATSPKYYATQIGKYTVEISGKTCSGKAETDTIVMALATSQIINPKLKTTTDSTVCLGDTVKMTLADGCNYSFLQWQKDGADIVGETSLNYKTLVGGVYRVKVTTSSVVSYTNTKIITVNTNCCTIMKSIANGTWETPSTWSCNRIPLETDDIVIDGHQINITTSNAKAKRITYRGGKINLANSTAKLLIKTN